MTTDGLREPRRAAEAMGARDVHGHGNGPRSGEHPTTVAVMPLWARPRAGVRG